MSKTIIMLLVLNLLLHCGEIGFDIIAYYNLCTWIK